MNLISKAIVLKKNIAFCYTKKGLGLWKYIQDLNLVLKLCKSYFNSTTAPASSKDF